MHKKRTICVVTGGRSEYGLLRSLMHGIKRDKRLRLRTVVTGMHWTRMFGTTVAEIRADGFVVDSRVDMTPARDTTAAMADSIGVGISGMVRAFLKLRPDIVVVLGDRVEALAAALASAYMNVPVAHIHGGDSAKAGLDENARHAITKLAHIHFAATKKSAGRIKRLGEDHSRVFVVGAPGLDDIVHTKLPHAPQLSRKFHIDVTRPFALVVQHPITTDAKNAASHMRETLEALMQTSLPSIVVYPNADAGGRGIIRIIDSYAKKSLHIHAYRSISRNDFLGLMKHASVMVGNSSSGIIEAASFRLPVVNVGSRQEGRERTVNVVDAAPIRSSIVRAVQRAFSIRFQTRIARVKNPYGTGKAGERMVRILASIPLGRALLQKKITY